MIPLLILSCKYRKDGLDSWSRNEFPLDVVYAYESVLQGKHPENHNVRAKTRSGQQLQFLRDKGVIEFVGRGRYRMKYANEKTLG